MEGVMKRIIIFIGIVAVAVSLSYFPGLLTQVYAQESIIDNGDPGTSSTGTWKTSGGPNPYGADSLFANQAGATYSFQNQFFDQGVLNVDVYQWWTYYNNRCTNTQCVFRPIANSDSGATRTPIPEHGEQ
jgi:hypothetical protein